MSDQSTLNGNFTLMRSVADTADARAGELRTLLGRFISDMLSVPPSVWDGLAAREFRTVVDRWNAESGRLCTALERIAETLRGNAGGLGSAGDRHADRIAAVGRNLGGR
ncbi:MAG: WXG100 family type VII secretion target [Mycolicibacterium insubricum]|nr:WXG100 family type VII secretion target [Mycobacterium sp.]